MIRVALFMTVLLATFGVPTHADTVDIYDLGPFPLVSSDGVRALSAVSGSEFVHITLLPPGGMFLAQITLPYNDYLLITEPGTNGTEVSDVLGVFDRLLDSGFIFLEFRSDPFSIGPGDFGGPGNWCALHRCLEETGSVQTAGTIVWSDGAGHSITDTVRFQSDVDSAADDVPEPASWLVFGGGLLMFGCRPLLVRDGRLFLAGLADRVA